MTATSSPVEWLWFSLSTAAALCAAWWVYRAWMDLQMVHHRQRGGIVLDLARAIFVQHILRCLVALGIAVAALINILYIPQTLARRLPSITAAKDALVFVSACLLFAGIYEYRVRKRMHDIHQEYTHAKIPRRRVTDYVQPPRELIETPHPR